jgi:hypothetical protein
VTDMYKPTEAAAAPATAQSKGMMNRNSIHEDHLGARRETTDPRRLTPPAGRVPAHLRDSYIADLESQVSELIGTEPKDFARAAILLYDICRLEGQDEEAQHLIGVFDLPAMVLYQTLHLVRAVDPADGAATPDEVNRALTRADDLIRLVILALEGDTSADIVRQMLDWRDAISRIGEHPERSTAISRAGDRLTHIVNAFFFDRLTAMPTLRDYIVGLELGI